MPQSHKLPFITTKPGKSIAIEVIRDKDFKTWLTKQDKELTTFLNNADFSPEKKKNMLIYDAKGEPKTVYTIAPKKLSLYTFAVLSAYIKSQLSESTLKKQKFTLKTTGLNAEDQTLSCMGWGLSAYEFDQYKAKKSGEVPTLLWPAKADKKRVKAYLESMFIVRDLINAPANDMGPVELEKAAKAIAQNHSAKTEIIADKKLIEKNFNLIHTVGAAGAKDRRPRLIDMKWGKKSHPKVTLVGKGVIFDTGGLNIKPGQYMALMKKDMGGAAHVLALANLIMSMKLPIQLRVLVPAVENAIAGEAFRPGDIIKSRKGIFVENTNTDAEGRLVLADALTYACEDNPELVIDYATLTGSARAALGHDIPAMFSTNDKTAQDIQKLSFELEDPLWQMPLYEKYYSIVENSTGDIINGFTTPGDLIYSALFLKKFITEKQEWVHLDLYAWENNGKPGRTKGGTDMGLRSIYAYLEKRFGK